LIAAPVIAIAVVIVLRFLLGVSDPDKPTREALADALAGRGPARMQRAVRLWLADRPRRWHAKVLASGLRFRATASIVEDRKRVSTAEQAAALDVVLDAAKAEASRIADAVRAKSTPEDFALVARKAADLDLPGETDRLVDDLWSSLEAVREAVAERSESIVDVPRTVIRQVCVRRLKARCPGDPRSCGTRSAARSECCLRWWWPGSWLAIRWWCRS
jgi:hypothetical protein